MQLIGELSPQPPYDFTRSIQLAQYHSVLDHVRDGEYWRALALNDAVALLRVVSTGSVQQPRLAVYLAAASGPVDETALRRRVAHLLGADSTLQPFYEFARQDAHLWSLVEPLYGLKHIRAASVFEALVTTIIEQQIALNLAQRGERWLVGWAGASIEYDGTTFATFPTPQRLAQADVSDLAPLKITRIRMNVILDVAQQIASGALDLETSRPVPAHQDTLMGLKGIGLWTAAWTLIRAVGDYIYIGENDVALQAAINHYWYGRTGRVAPPVVRDTLQVYGDYAGVVVFHTLMRWALRRYGS